MARSKRRFLIFRSPEAREPVCACSAYAQRHALRLARRLARLDALAVAVPE